jgi:hypothetical protein
MQFWEEMTSPVRWMLALSILAAIGMLSFRQCATADQPVEVLRQRGIGAAALK